LVFAMLVNERIKTQVNAVHLANGKPISKDLSIHVRQCRTKPCGANKKEWHIKIIFSILLKSLKFREIKV